MSLVTQSRRVPCGLLGNLGVLGRGHLGCSGAAFGVPSSLCFPATFVTCAASPPQLLPQLRSVVSSLCCGARLAVQRCHRTGISRTGILQQVVCDSESHGRLASCNKSFAPQPLCSPIPVPYGNFSVCPPISAPRRLDGFYLLTRRLPPSPCPSGFAEVFALLRGFGSFPVQGPLVLGFLRCHKCSPGSWLRSPPLCISLVSGSYDTWTTGSSSDPRSRISRGRGTSSYGFAINCAFW